MKIKGKNTIVQKYLKNGRKKKREKYEKIQAEKERKKKNEGNNLGQINRLTIQVTHSHTHLVMYSTFLQCGGQCGGSKKLSVQLLRQRWRDGLVSCQFCSLCVCCVYVCVCVCIPLCIFFWLLFEAWHKALLVLLLSYALSFWYYSKEIFLYLFPTRRLSYTYCRLGWKANKTAKQISRAKSEYWCLRRFGKHSVSWNDGYLVMKHVSELL